MLTNTHYATSLLPPSSSPLAQPKTTDKRFFLNGFRLTTPQAKLEEKKAEKETKRQWRRVEHALLLRCSAGAMIILGSDKYLESEFEQLISTKSNKNKNNAQKGKRPIMPSFKALSETCTKDNWQKLMARRRQQRQTTDRQTKRQLKQEKRAATWIPHTDAALTHIHTHTHARALLPLVYIYIYLHTPLCTHIHVHIHTHMQAQYITSLPSQPPPPTPTPRTCPTTSMLTKSLLPLPPQFAGRSVSEKALWRRAKFNGVVFCAHIYPALV